MYLILQNDSDGPDPAYGCGLRYSGTIREEPSPFFLFGCIFGLFLALRHTCTLEEEGINYLIGIIENSI